MTTISKQKGISLIVGLIMLVLITLMVVTSFNIAGSHLMVVNNSQIQTELEAAANAAIEQAISSTDVVVQTSDYLKPAGVDLAISQFESAATGTAQAKTAVTVNVKASCEKARTLSNKEAASVSKDCLWDPDTGGAYIEDKTSASSESLCAEALWNINASTSAPNDSRAKMEVNQGVSMNVSRTVTSDCGS